MQKKENCIRDEKFGTRRIFYIIFALFYMLLTFLTLFSCNLIGSRSVGNQSFEIGEVTYTKDDIISGAIFKGDEHVKVTYSDAEESPDLTKAPHVKACSLVAGKLTLVGTGEEASLITAMVGEKEFTALIKDGVFQLSINLLADDQNPSSAENAERPDESTIGNEDETIKTITITAKVKGKKSSLPVILSASLDDKNT